MSEPNEAPPTKYQPSRITTAVNMIWRADSLGYNAPAAFFNVCGKVMMTFGQIHEAVAGWNTFRAENPDYTKKQEAEWFKELKNKILSSGAEELE